MWENVPESCLIAGGCCLSDLRVRLAVRRVSLTGVKPEVRLSYVSEGGGGNISANVPSQLAWATRCSTSDFFDRLFFRLHSGLFLLPDDFLYLSLDLEWEILASRKCNMGGPGAATTWSGVSPNETHTIRPTSGCRTLSAQTAVWKVNYSLLLLLLLLFCGEVLHLCVCTVDGRQRKARARNILRFS